ASSGSRKAAVLPLPVSATPTMSTPLIPIQRQAIPIGMSGVDMVGVAETGSGKTAAFLLPLLAHILRQPPTARAATADQGPLALIMAPVRELAQQIEAEAIRLAAYTGIKCTHVVGGTSIEAQSFTLRAGVDIVIGTPGRLIDVLEQGFLVLHQCAYVVLDEADRMIDMGFEPQVLQILDAMGAGLPAPPTTAGAAPSSAPPPASGAGSSASSDRDAAVFNPATTRIMHMFTATMPPEVERITKRYLKSPVTVKIGDVVRGNNKRIKQEVIYLPNETRKRAKLLEMLARCPRPVIVFVNAKKQCDVVARDIENKGFRCVVLHSGKSQDVREDALAEFKSGGYDVLVATDVAGRGLDIPDVAQVINYDMPSEIARYTHRIGRTGRAGKSGQAMTFFTDADAPMLPDLKAYLESTEQDVPHDLAVRASGDKSRENVRYAKK
ncbi:DEAD/DEAH box helicase, partial [archaeon]